MVAIHSNLFLCVHTCIAMNLCGCPFITISPGAFRRFDYFLHLRNEKTEAWRSGVPRQRSSFEPSSDGPRTPTLAATPGNPQGKSSIWFPHVLCAQLWLERRLNAVHPGMGCYDSAMKKGNGPPASFNMVATSHMWFFKLKFKLVKIK